MISDEIISFVSFQLSQIRNGNLKLFFSKIIKALRFIITILPMYILAIPMVLFFRLIRSIKLVRFVKIRSDVIGNSVFDLEYFLSKRELGKKTFCEIYYFSTQTVCNSQWELMVRRNFRIFSFVRYLDQINQLLPGGKDHIVKMVSDVAGSRDLTGVLYRTKPHMSFTGDENTQGYNFLKQLGMRSGEGFNCFIVRDSVYKSKNQNWIKKDWTYHNYRDADIDTFKDAALILAEKGYGVFRMGKDVEKPFIVNHPNVLDYANSSYRNDFLDIWLMANCRYCVTVGTGLDDVCVAFRRPLVEVNQLPVAGIRCNQAFTVEVFKKLKYKSTGKFLGLDEIIETGAITFFHSKDYEDLGIEIINNTSEEIVNAVIEMEGRFNDTWIEEPKDIELQNTFWRKFNKSLYFNRHGLKTFGTLHPKSRISAHFLRENHNWFLT